MARLILRKIRNDPRVSREITPRDKLSLIDQKFSKLASLREFVVRRIHARNEFSFNF